MASKILYFTLNYHAQVILKLGTGVEIKGEKVPITFVELKMEVEEKDPEFKDVKLRWDDYYTALGTKTITIIGGKPCSVQKLIRR